MSIAPQAKRQRTQPSTPSPRPSAQIDSRTVRKSVNCLLRHGLNKYQLKLNSNLLEQLQTEFEGWFDAERREILSQLKNIPDHAKQTWLEERFEINDRRKRENQPIRLLTDFLFQFAQIQIQQLQSLKHENAKFRKVFGKVRGQAEREKLILHYAGELGAGPRQLKQDALAFSRWFDEEAVMDRYARLVGQIELMLTFVFDRLSEVLIHVFRLAYRYHLESKPESTDGDDTALHQRLSGIWKRLNIEGRVHEALMYDGDDRVHAAVLQCMAAAIRMLPDELGAKLLDRRTLVFIHRAAMENNSDVWIQCEALTILASLSFLQAIPFLKHRLEHPNEGDDMFVRRHVLKLLESRMLLAIRNEEPRDFEIPSPSSEPSPFVRQKLAKIAYLATHPASHQHWRDLALQDPVPQVRAAAILAGTEVTLDLDSTLEYLQVVADCLQSESDPFVLRTAMHCLVQKLDQLASQPQHGNESLADDPVPTQTKSESLCKGHEQVDQHAVRAFYAKTIQPLLIRLETQHSQTSLRRWAAQTHEQIWSRLDPQANQLIRELKPLLYNTRPGKSCRIPSRTFRNVAPDKLGRIFAILAQDDFGYDIHKTWFGYRILRGQTLGFRLWRMIHECRHTATDKRQAIRHTVGRISNATMRAPSQILGELSETKVPGEPLTIAEDGTWRPFLPLPDDFISTLNLSWLAPRTVRFYTSQGITLVTGPRRIFKQLKAARKLNLHFSKLADQRNWDDESVAANSYVQAMRKLGFEIEFRRYSSDDVALTDEQGSSGSEESSQPEPNDETVNRFFMSAMMGIPLLANFAGSSFWKYVNYYADYFGSAFENTLEQLVIFAGAILLFAVGKHFYANYTFRKARRKIPISIGGWGTRGKSGTERLKAALIGEMGHGLVSKTTGCEAMFIHANPHGDPLEIPLFRPYDKATIWEQRNLIRMASRMNPSVFLWECMALTPAYVDVLQRQWTSDDLGTITNTYPDHEDVQGPAGYNVAQTISGFVPLNSHLISTEQVMRPYVTESCRQAKTSFRGVGWLESGLITDDILERFPYKEHPDNIALVAAMADELGCEYEFSLKAMADSLVPDLGVLKTHPVATVRTRRVEFTNGMSANERFGCMGNWRRLGFDKQDPWQEPTTWVTGVVNNRADRVPRSKVFAKIIVEDIHADRFYLIGSNLKGLKGFIEEAWSEKAASISLRDKTQKWITKLALEKLTQAAWNYRQPIESAHVEAKLKRIAEALSAGDGDSDSDLTQRLPKFWREPEQVKNLLQSADAKPEYIASIYRHQTEWLAALDEYEQMKTAIEKASVAEAEATERKFVNLLKTWFERKLIVIENVDATGEEVVAELIDTTPPGFLNRTMGLQNIKGTGLDFVYRFQAWDMCHEACLLAQAKTVQSTLKGLQALVAMPVIGQLCENEIRSVIQQGKTNPLYRRPELAALLDQLERKLQQATGIAEWSTDHPRNGKQANSFSRMELNRWILETAEQFLDVHDSIHRRVQADLIYHDLANERISRQRAVVELRKINKRQKGGWLGKKLKVEN